MLVTTHTSLYAKKHTVIFPNQEAHLRIMNNNIEPCYKKGIDPILGHKPKELRVTFKSKQLQQSS